MNHLKSLASQTAVYGISSVLARLLNYLLVPLHTLLFSKGEFGPVPYFYALGAFLLIIYTHGMETTFFRFSTKTKDPKSYDYAITSVIIVSLIISAILLSSASSLATLAGYPGQGWLLQWLVIIIFIDAITAIPFAKMRLENNARKFAVTKVAIIIINISLQLLFLVVAPALINSGQSGQFIQLISSLYNPELGIGYIFLANLIANVFLLFFIWPYFRNFTFRLNAATLKPMLFYALPLLLMGLAGTISDQLDKILVRNYISDEALGVYAQTFKLAVFIILAIQAFRYAGEPFFFSRAKDKNAPRLFADVLYYFVIFELIIYIVVSFNIDLIGTVMLKREEYRVALYLVPVIMLGKLFYGIYLNISIWFKLKDKTIYGLYFTLLGAVITIAGNMLLIPVLGYDGSAITVILVYVSMTVACYLSGRKHFPVPYKIGPMAIHILVGIILVALSFVIQLDNTMADSMLNIGATVGYIAIIWLIEKKNLTIKSY